MASDDVAAIKDENQETIKVDKKPQAESINLADGVDIKKLLEAGAHFGHKTSRWHPKMAQYIHSKRNGSHVIDLTKTVENLEIALNFVEQTASEGKQILLVGTKRQAYDAVKNAAIATGMPYVVERWLGGMLTNRNTISGRIKHLKDLEQKMENGQLASKFNKLEVQRFQEEIELMNLQYGGIKDIHARPGAVFVTDIINDANAVREARKLNIPIVAIVDTNTDPSNIDYPIPANDDALRSVQLITEYIQAAIEAGKAKAAKNASKDAPDKDESKPTEKGGAK